MKCIITFRQNLLFVCLFISLTVVGQKQINGTIIDEKTREALIGATITEKGANNGTITDINGKFNLKLALNATIIVSYMGYVSKEIVIANDKPLVIELSEKARTLDEVVVIGYGVQRKSDVTGAISSISGKDINNVPVASAMQAIQGKAAGVQIVQNTGAPGSSSMIKIRGTGTINDADPLYVVDGFIVDGITHINPNDIANIEILKDAASCAVYGARSANGVVLITTKNGESGKLKINFDTYAGFSQSWREIKVMDIQNFALMRDYVDGSSNYSVDGKLFQSKDPLTSNYYYDAGKFQRIDTIARNSPRTWWDAVTQPGLKQQYNLSINGGTEQHKYLISVNYYDEKGIVKKSDYNKFSTRINSNDKIASWLTAQSNLLYTFEGRNIVPEGQNGVLKRALYQSPMVYTYNNAGYYSESHPLAIIDRNHDFQNTHRIDLNFTLTAKINSLLSYQFKVSDYVSFQNRDQFFEVNKPDESFLMPWDLTSVAKYQTTINKWEVNNLLTFGWKNDKHDINAVIGQTVEGYNFDYHYAIRRGADGNTDNYWYLSAGYKGDLTRGYANEWTSLGFLGRINYNLLNRYLFQVNFRSDASSKFSPKERWGYFPSASVGWKFSSESFLQNADWLSLGKLRFGWGKLGNNRIDEYARYTIIENQFNYAFGTGNHILYPGGASTVLGNPNIRWEKTETYNIGLDLGFFNNKLTTSIEVFNKLTTDMLLRVPVPVSAGLNDAPMTNAGAVNNKGIELIANYKGDIGKLKYEVGFNVSWIRNEVVSLGTGNEPIYGARLTEPSILDYITKTEVGKSIGGFYGYVTDGIFNTLDEVEASAQYEEMNIPNTTPGDFRFKDLNGDGRITADDRTYLGSPHPDFVFGLPITLSYANFDLSVFFQGQTGNKIFNVMEYYLNSAHGGGNLYADIRSKHWSGDYRPDRAFFPENHNATVPDLDGADRPRNFRASDFYVKDGSYVRLQNIRLNYNFPQAVCRLLKLNDLSVFAGAYNLLTFTRYNGFDPEVGKNGDSEGNNLYLGVDHGNYPQARTITTGLKFSF